MCKYLIWILQLVRTQLGVAGLSSRFAFCYDLTPFNYAFLLYLKTDNCDCEGNTILVLDSEGKDFSLHSH